MKKNIPPALIVLELPDFKRRHSLLNFPLFALTLLLTLIFIYGFLGNKAKTLFADKDTPLSYGIYLISEENKGEKVGFN